jgi:hypothetical protein
MRRHVVDRDNYILDLNSIILLSPQFPFREKFTAIHVWSDTGYRLLKRTGTDLLSLLFISEF